MGGDRLHAHDVAIVAGEVQAVDLPHDFRLHRIELEPALVSAPVADDLGRGCPEAKGRHGAVPVPLAGVLPHRPLGVLRVLLALVLVEQAEELARHLIVFRTTQWNDEDLRGLQNFLLATPDAGDLIPGGSGLRKLRWAVRGRGKRGGARVIYFRQVPMERIYLIYAYVKSAQADPTPKQIKTLAQLMKDNENG